MSRKKLDLGKIKYPIAGTLEEVPFERIIKEYKEKDLKSQVITLIDLLQKKRDAYYAINKKLSKLQGDFSTHINYIDTEIESAVVDFLDAILGDESASYYLYEASNMKKGGSITENGKKYPLRNIKDLKAYVFREEV